MNGATPRAPGTMSEQALNLKGPLPVDFAIWEHRPAPLIHVDVPPLTVARYGEQPNALVLREVGDSRT